MRNGAVLLVLLLVSTGCRDREAEVSTTRTRVPSAAELDGIRSTDPQRQIQAAQALMDRTMTPELIAALQTTWPANPRAEVYFQCLKARVPGRETLEPAYESMPRGLVATMPPLEVEKLECMTAALAERAEEDPLRMRELLSLWYIRGNDAVRRNALEGLRKLPAANPPGVFQHMFAQGTTEEKLRLVDLALDLDGLQHFPWFIEQLAGIKRSERYILGEGDPQTEVRTLMLQRLVENPHPRAAQILARALVRTPDDPVVDNSVRARQARFRDIEAAFKQIANDDFAEEQHRVAARRALTQFASR